MRVSVISSTCYIDFDGWRIVVSGQGEGAEREVKITQPQIYKILEFFAQHPGEYFSKKELLKECWGITDAGGGYDNTFYPQIANCRKLSEELGQAIENKPGWGYRYNGEKITDIRAADTALNMTDVRGFCIGDMDHSGCQVRREESGPKATTAVIDFSLTDSKLCSVVYFTGRRDWSQLAGDYRLCFAARAVPGPVQAEVEVRLKGRDTSVPVLLQERPDVYEIPMREFASPEAWEEVQEIHFLFRRGAVSARTAVTIENLCLKG